MNSKLLVLFSVLVVVTGVVAVFNSVRLQKLGPYTNERVTSKEQMTVDGSTTAAVPARKDLLITLDSVGTSTQSGIAQFTEVDGKVTVALTMLGFPINVQSAHIHSGLCPKAEAVRYPLKNVELGKSKTTLNTTIAQLASELPLSIDIHGFASGSEAGVCGNVEL